ncbi:hypothetical protein CCR75_006581 [Bremia lactucae]|uniref:C2 domain-containing protein n=1 Tax=Bremia lactucae TaxID=4779 RepID=A0A976FI07_BRELC|nr:hypothetical protein CCR75_006581 [Bremia lactucae]
MRSTSQPEPSPMPLALITKRSSRLPSLSARAQFANCASMTRSFLTKSFPTPKRKLWGSQRSPTGVDDPMEVNMASDEQDNEGARGDIGEMIVVAIQKVTVSGSDEGRASQFGSRIVPKSSIWGATKWSQGQSRLPQRIQCTVRSGTTNKVSAQSERSANEYTFDEKFVFERRDHDAQYNNVIIEVSCTASNLKGKHILGQVAADLDIEFAAQAPDPIYKHTALTRVDGVDMALEIHYVLHRLVVPDATAAAASRVLTRSSTSLNDDDDMNAYGQIFPDLWYLC